MRYCIIKNDYDDKGVFLYYCGNSIKEGIGKIIAECAENDLDPKELIVDGSCIYTFKLRTDWTVFPLRENTTHIVLCEDYYNYDLRLVGETDDYVIGLHMTLADGRAVLGDQYKGYSEKTGDQKYYWHIMPVENMD